jgi:hypothetical protein
MMSNVKVFTIGFTKKTEEEFFIHLIRALMTRDFFEAIIFGICEGEFRH